VGKTLDTNIHFNFLLQLHICVYLLESMLTSSVSK